jgi:hypothetical protein
MMTIHVHNHGGGELLNTDLPSDCIADCSAPGQRDADVARWREVLGFTVDRQDAIRGLAEYGAWSTVELASMGDHALAEIVLWLAAGNFAEYEHEARELGIDPRVPIDERPEFDPRYGSDVFTLD